MTRLTGSGFTSDILPLILSMAAVVAVLYLCYLFSKFIAKKANRIADSTNIHILEKVVLAQDKGLALAEICGSYYLIGFSNNGVEILHELSKEDVKTQQSSGIVKNNFLEILNTTLKNRMDVNMLGRNNARPNAEDHSKGNGEEKK